MNSRSFSNKRNACENPNFLPSSCSPDAWTRPAPGAGIVQGRVSVRDAAAQSVCGELPSGVGVGGLERFGVAWRQDTLTHDNVHSIRFP